VSDDLAEVQVVCLDAAGTLFDEREGRVALYGRAFREAGVDVPDDVLGRWMGEAHDALPEVVEGQPRYSDAWFRAFVSALLRRAGSGLPAEPLRAHLADVFTRPETYVVHADVPDALEDLVARGLRLALVSNWSDRLPGLLEALGLRRFFEVLAVSAVVGRAKPHPAIFRAALDPMGVAPQRALHVGDREDNDLAGARRAGLAAWLLDREGRRPPSPEVVRDLGEVVRRLASR
jgi:REG-2-like HAD superfamily hydrolase